MKENLASQLQTALSANVEGLKIWLEDKKIDARVLAAQPKIKENIVSLIEYASKEDVNPEDLIKTRELTWLREHLGAICRKYGFTGFVVFDPTGYQVGALLDEPVGKREFTGRSDFFYRSLQDDTVVSRPFEADVLLPDRKGAWNSNWPTMFVSTPVYSNIGELVGVLAFRIRPEVAFTRMLEVTRPGSSGETYAFNDDGLIISDSRFNEQLKKIGLIKDRPDSRAILNIEIRDPGTNMIQGNRPKLPRKEQPLTKMAKSALNGETSFDVDGYNDYRGVPVVGAWTWLPEYYFGVTTEIDKDEAFEPLYLTRKTFSLIFSVLAITTIIAFLLSFRQKRFEMELRNSNESLKNEIAGRHRAEDLTARFGRILDDSFNEIYFFNEHNLKYIQVNNGARQNLGYSAEELSLLTPFDVKPDFTQEQFEALIQPLRERKQSKLVFETVHQRKDGSLYPVESLLQLSTTEEQPIFVAIIKDITERKKAEKALRASEERARLVIDTANDAFIATNSNGQIIEWNNTAEEIFGWRRDEVIGKKISETIIPVNYREQHDAGFEKFLETEKSTILNTRVEVNALHREGHEFPVEISMSPIKVDGSYQFNAFILDITERKSIQTQLNHAQKMESIGQLAAGIAHEINTPMQFVGDNTKFLQDSFSQIFGTVKAHDRLLVECKKGTVSEKMVEDMEASIQNSEIEYLSDEIPLAIQQSLEGVERVSKIVKAMKEFSHPGSEYKIPTDINRAIDTTLKVAKNEWKYLAKVVTNFDPNLPLVPCFVNDFNQVILNTVVNAAHAIGDVVKNSGELGTITLSTRQDGDWAEIRIQDTGTGIPEDIKANIFDPFFTTKEVGKGTGQGLSIVHSIVSKKHQGEVSLETEQGKGTTFIFRFPVTLAG